MFTRVYQKILNVVQRALMWLAMTEVGIYIYCIVVDIPKDIKKILQKKTALSWIVLIGNIVMTNLLAGTPYENLAKTIMFVMVFIA